MDPSERGTFPVLIDDPRADDLTRPFWEAALEGRLVAPRCRGCGTWLLPPEPVCFSCQGRRFEWRELAGTGTLYTYTVVRHALSPLLRDVVPYVAGVVDLDGTQGAGARMIANVVGCEPDEVTVGMRLRVRFDRVSSTYAAPRFVPVRPER